MKYKVVIVDDEEHCINTLKWQLEQYCADDVDVIAVFSEPNEAIKEILILKPDIVFTDIEMPALSGLELAANIENLVDHIVFTTAYDQYAIKAIKLNVLDYLLKPIDRNELMETIEKIKTIRSVKKDKQDNTNQELRKSKFVNNNIKS